MNIIKYPARDDWKTITVRPHIDMSKLNATVSEVLNDIRANGDEAVKRYEQKFDHAELHELQVSKSELHEAQHLVSDDLRQALMLAHDNIRKFHEAQAFQPIRVQTAPGVECWQKSVAIEKVGLYIPGGTAPLFSTVLMLATPAKIAGCKEIVLCTPPDSSGHVNPAILVAAHIAGVSRIYKIGGVQADDTSNPRYVAADLLSQAEHGVDSQVLLISTSEPMLYAVQKEVETQLQALPRKEIAAKTLENSKLVLVRDADEAMALSNAYAPEHLIIATAHYEALEPKVVNAGSVFLGKYACESAGDYASGTNHTLPTHGYADAYSGVNLDSFMRKITFQHLDEQGIHSIGHAVEVMAENEQLFAHKNAMTLRCNDVANNQ